MTESSCCLQKWNRNSGCRTLYNCLPQVLCRLSYIHLHPPLELIKLVGHQWQLALPFMMKVMVWYFVTLTRLWPHSFLCLLWLAQTDMMVTFKVLLWSFLCNFTRYTTHGVCFQRILKEHLLLRFARFCVSIVFSLLKHFSYVTTGVWIHSKKIVKTPLMSSNSDIQLDWVWLR